MNCLGCGNAIAPMYYGYQLNPGSFCGACLNQDQYAAGIDYHCDLQETLLDYFELFG